MGLKEVPGGGAGAEARVEDGPGGLSVQGDADAAGDGAGDGGGDQRVDEFERLHALEYARRPEPVGGVGGLFRAQPGDVRREFGRDLGAEHGAGPGVADGGGAEAFDAGDEAAALGRGGEVAQQVGAGLGGDEAAVAHLRGQLDRFEGVAGGDGPAFAAERVVGVAAEGFADESGDGGGAERFESEGAPARAARQSAQGLGVVREFFRSVGDDEQERQFLGAWSERGEPAQGLRVGPVGVVEDEDHGGLLHGEVGEHPVEAVAQALRVGRRAFGGGAEAEGGAHDRVPTAQRGTEIGG